LTKTTKIKTFRIDLDDRYNEIIDRAVKDKQHLWNNLVLILNNTKSKDIKKTILSPPEMMKIVKRKKINLSLERHYKDQLEVFRSFHDRYASDIINTIFREFSSKVKTNFKSDKNFRMKTRRLSSTNTGVINVENNNVTYYNGKGGRMRKYSREFGIQLFNRKYMKIQGIKNNIKVYFNDKKIKGSEILIVSLIKNYNRYRLSIVYKYTYDKDKSKRDYLLSIDPGSNNHLSIFSNNPKAPSLIIKYSSISRLLRTESNVIDRLKSNMEKNKYLVHNFYSKRKIIMNQEINKITSRIKDYCIKYDIGKVIIGNGYSSKKSSKMNRKNNRKFHSFPHYTFKLNLEDKLMSSNIQVIDQEESYTSKISCLDLTSEVWNFKYEKDMKPTNAQRNNGVRSSQGLFLDKVHMKSFHADINGAINIMMKYLKKRIIPNNNQLFNPVKIKDDFQFLKVLSW